MIQPSRSLLLVAASLALMGFSTARAQTITSATSSLTFSWQQGAKLPASQAVSLRVSSGTPAYVASTPPQDAWLIATPDTGTLPATLTVQVNPSTLSPGVYPSSITVNALGVASPLIIPVTLTVTTASGSPTVNPTALSVTSPGTLTGTLSVSAGALPATYTATSGTPWLSVSSTAGALLPAQATTITVTANPGNLVPQTAPYSGKITVVTSSNSVSKTQTITVSLLVNPVTPVVSSIWPLQIPLGSPDTVVTIRGANFYSGTTVSATGLAAALKTTIVSGDVLLTTIPAPSLASAGIINLTVTNPAPATSASPVGVTVGNASVISGITNAASFLPGSVSPGEIISIFGQNIGPSPAVQLTVVGGFAQTNVGNVTVTIDGQAAPIIYASNAQVSVQVPYEVTLGSAKTLVLTYGSATPATTNVDINPSAPGLFTLNASGTGSALILNFDPVTGAYSINSSTNPAHVGTIIVCFVTGEGDYASVAYPVETGFIVPLTPPPLIGAYPQLGPLPAVTIGGVAATSVGYAGPIPGGLLGLLQINATVPTGASTGNATPLAISLSGVQTQAGTTIAVK